MPANKQPLTEIEQQLRRDIKTANERVAYAARTYGLESREYQQQVSTLKEYIPEGAQTYTQVSGAPGISLSKENIRKIASSTWETHKIEALIGGHDEDKVWSGLLKTKGYYQREDKKLVELYEKEHKGKKPTKQALARFKSIKTFVEEYLDDPFAVSPPVPTDDDEDAMEAYNEYMDIMHKSHKTYEELYRAAALFEGLNPAAYKKNLEMLENNEVTPRGYSGVNMIDYFFDSIKNMPRR